MAVVLNPRAAGLGDIQPIRPAYASGRWYSDGFSRSTSTIVPAADIIYAAPIVVYDKTTISQLAIRVVTAGTTSNVKLGIFASDPITGLPGALLGQTVGAATTSVNTSVEIALGSSVTLQPGTYWLASIHNGTVLPVCYSVVDLNPPTALLGSATSAGSMLLSTECHSSVSGSGSTYAGGFPSTFPTPTYLLSTNGTPKMAFKVA